LTPLVARFPDCPKTVIPTRPNFAIVYPPEGKNWKNITYFLKRAKFGRGGPTFALNSQGRQGKNLFEFLVVNINHLFL